MEINNNDVNPKPMQSRSLANSPWPMFRNNLNHTGLSPYDTSSNTGKLIWNFTTGDIIYSSPVIDSNGTIYIGSHDNCIYAIYPNHTKKWSFTTADWVISSAAIGVDGTIYVGSYDNKLYAIHPNGTMKWSYSTGDRVYSSPAIGTNGTIYVGSYDNKLHAIHPNGSMKWSFTTGGDVISSPAIDSNGTIYIGSYDNELYAIHPNGSMKWSFTTGAGILSSPAIGPNGTIYIGSYDNNLYAIHPNGTMKWSFTTSDDVFSSPAIGSDGTVYIGSMDDNLYAIHPNGTMKWSFTTGDHVSSSPAISSEGTIFVGSWNLKLYAIHPNGTMKWNYTTGDRVYSSPAIGSDGTIYIGSLDDNLYAIGNPSLLSAGIVMPLSGYSNTHFNYTVNYIHKYDKKPVYVNVSIDCINYTMNETDLNDIDYSDGKDYFFNITHLDIGAHTYRFYASDGLLTSFTGLLNDPIVNNTPPNIITLNNLTAIEDEYYEVSYEYDDIDLANVYQIGTWDFSTNASWLSFTPTTAMLYGTPTNDDVGKYWLNISINDTIEIDFTNFTLTVIGVNDDPVINTTNVEITYEDTLYFIDYNATDIDSFIENQIWTLDTNATSWLDIDSTTGILNGIPTNDDVGEYWVNVSVEDGDNGLDYTNFTLIVLNVNDRPEIITEDDLVANANILYMIDYNATDIDSPLSQLRWFLDTNATWLDVDLGTGFLSGTPLISDLGWYNVNISVDDSDGGQDWHEFILTVEKGNEPPEITTIDKVSITAGKLYNVIYEATDDRTPVDSLIWFFKSNASWLSFNTITRVLRGSPTLAHVGWYWVNVTVGDGEGGFDSHNFTVTVYATANQPPDITTEDDINAIVEELYSVDYEADDDRTPGDKLQWLLETNTSNWLSIDPITGILMGTPKFEDVGSYWVKVSVFDGEDGWDHSDFTLYVTIEPITSFPPELSNPSMTPASGDTETLFTFSVDYSHLECDPPDSIQVVIDGNAYNMEATNGHYEYSTKLSEGNHTYYFTTTLGDFVVNTDEYQTGYIDKPTDIEPDDGDGDEDNTMLYAGSGIVVIIIIVVLILLFIFLKKKKGKEEEAPVVEEPPPPEEVPPEVPPEQPPAPEVPPEQVPVPETLPEQPQVPEIPPEQPPPPEVTPQVTQPQVEPAPEPAPLPQVGEQPAPQPQAEPQPQGQAQVPKIKTPPTIKENDS